MYTDYFGSPLAVGDEIIYPVSSGSNRACFLRCPIQDIVPLIPHRSRPHRLMRADQANQEYATDYPMRPVDKQFVLKVTKVAYNGRERTMSIRFPENVIRVPDGV